MSTEKKGKGDSLLNRLMLRNDFSAIAATVFLFAVFAIGSDNFLSLYNVSNMSRTAALYMFIALGQMFVMVTGNMNLAIGAIGGFCSVMFGIFVQDWGLPLWLSILGLLAVGMACGLANALISLKLKLPSFVATLTTSFIFTGLVSGISGGYPYTDIPEAVFVIGRGKFLGLPYLLYLAIVVSAFVWYFFKFTVLGRRMLATGGNLTASRLSGIKTDRMVVAGHVLSGAWASVATYLWISRTGSATPLIGQDWMMLSFPICVIGGTSIAGGEVSGAGLIFASFLMAMIKNGLVMLEVNVYFEQAFMGGIMLLAVCFETFRVRLNKARRI